MRLLARERLEHHAVAGADTRARTSSSRPRSAVRVAASLPCEVARARRRGSLRARAARAARRARSRRATTPGCPGSPKTSVAPRTPNASGLPGLDRDAPEDLLDAELAATRRTRSCGPTETPPEVTSTSAREAALERVAVRVLVVGDRREPLDVGARRARARRRASARSTRRSRRARAARPGGAARCPWSSTATRGRRAQTTSRDAGRRERADLRGPEPRAGVDDGVAGTRRRRRAGGRCRRAPTRSAISTSLSSLDNALDGHDRVGALGHDAAGRDPHRLARLRARAARAARLRSARRPAAARECRPRARRSRPSRSSGTAAGRRAAAPARRARGRPPPRAGQARRRAARARPARPPAPPRASAARPSRAHAIPLVISVVVPVHNEERSVALLYDELARALDPLGAPLGGRSSSTTARPTGRSRALTRLHAAHDERARRPAAPQLRQGRRARRRASTQAGGEIIVTIDGDLQDDPAEIPRLLAKLDEGFDLVSGWKTTPARPARATRCSRASSTAVDGRVSGVRLHDMNCGLKAYRAEVVRGLRALRRAAPLHAGARALARLPHRRAAGQPPAARARPLALRLRALPARLPRPAHRLLHRPLPPPAAAPVRRPRPAPRPRRVGDPRLPDRRSRRSGTRSGSGRC